MAVPDRIKLFRAQMGRAVGGNSRRTSHNPPDPVMLDIYDALGTMRGPLFTEPAKFIGVFAHGSSQLTVRVCAGTVVMDETRQFDAENTSVDALASLVRRDRNHPSVAMWSFCNGG